MFPEGEVRHYREALDPYLKTVFEETEKYQERIIEIYDKYHAGEDTEPAEDASSGDPDIDAEIEKAKKDLRDVVGDPRVEELVRQGLIPAFEAVDLQFKSDIEAITGVNPILNDARIAPFVEKKIEENVDRIRTIPERHISQIEDEVARAIEQGTSRSELEERIRGVSGTSVFNAERIARDQIGDVQGNMSLQRMRDAGMRVFRWSTVGDDRVRPGHRRLNGDVIDIETGDTSGNSDTGFPGLDIQCRCTAEVVIDEAQRVYGRQTQEAER